MPGSRNCFPSMLSRTRIDGHNGSHVDNEFKCPWSHLPSDIASRLFTEGKLVLPWIIQSGRLSRNRHAASLQMINLCGDSLAEVPSSSE